VAAAAAERMTFFSDAVVAIAITLLAIELPVPEGETVAELWAGLQHDAFEYLAFVISFLVIANHWSAHHRIFRWLRRAEPPLVQLNFLWLFLVVINPFLTRIITEGDLNWLRFGLYAVAQALMMLTIAVTIAVGARRGWFAADAPRWLTDRGWVRSTVGAFAFAVSVPLYPLLGQWAFAVWILVPVVTGRLLRLRGLPAHHD
jgi:uncharacterized membrane protein